MGKQLQQYTMNKDLGWEVATDQIDNCHAINKFGYNAQVGSDWETVWDGNNAYTYIDTASTAQVTSSDTDDNGGTVLVSGLDADFAEVSETLTIGGSAGVQLFYRIHRAQMVTATTGQENQGTVTVTCDSKSAAIISPQIGQTLMAIYTVPRGYRAYVVQLDVGCAKDQEHHIRLVSKTNGGVWNTKALLTQRGGFADLDFKVPLAFSAESDIEVKVKASATSAVSAGFEIIFVKD